MRLLVLLAAVVGMQAAFAQDASPKKGLILQDADCVQYPHSDVVFKSYKEGQTVKLTCKWQRRIAGPPGSKPTLCPGEPPWPRARDVEARRLYARWATERWYGTQHGCYINAAWNVQVLKDPKTNSTLLPACDTDGWPCIPMPRPGDDA